MLCRVGYDISIHYNAQIFVISVFNFPHVRLRCHENTTGFAKGPAGIYKIHAGPLGEMGHISVAWYIMVEWYSFPNKYTTSYKQNEYHSNIISPAENMNNEKCYVVVSAAISTNVIDELKGV